MKPMLLGLLLILAGCAPVNSGVTYSQYRSAQLGMTYKQVASLFGSDGAEIDMSEALPPDYPYEPGADEIAYQWKGNGNHGANVTAMFKGDQLTGVAYAGLSVPGRRDKRPSVGMRSNIGFLNFER